MTVTHRNQHIHTMQSAPRAHRAHAQRQAHNAEQQHTRQAPPQTTVTYAALQQAEQEEDAEAEAAAAAAIRRSPYRSHAALAHAHARASDDVHTQLSSLKAENTLLGSIIQQLQLDRQNKAALLLETAQAKEALSARCTALESQLGSDSELKDALVAQSGELSQATQALRLLKLSSHRQIAEVCSSWKAEVEQVRREHEQQLKSMRNRHGAYANTGRSVSRMTPRPGSQMQQQRPPSQQQQQQHAAPSSSQNDAPTRPFSQQSTFSHRSLHDAPSTRAQHAAPSKAGQVGDSSYVPQRQQQQEDQQEEEEGSSADFDHDPLQHIEERCSMLELALEREQASNLALRSAALTSSQESTQLHDRLAALTAQSRAQLESIQGLQSKLFAMQGQLESYDVQRRMQQSRKVLDQLHVDQPVSALAPAAVSGAPTRAIAAVTTAASASSSFNAAASASASAASDHQAAAALRLLQSELCEERRLVTELRALYSLSHDTERSLRAQLIQSTDFSLQLQRSLKSAQVAHRAQSEEAVDAQQRLLRIERDYHRAQRELRYANQLLRSYGSGGDDAQDGQQPLDTPASLSQSQQHPSHATQPEKPSSSYQALHFAATLDEDEITQITNAARQTSKFSHESSREMLPSAAAERDRPVHQQRPSRFR